MEKNPYFRSVFSDRNRSRHPAHHRVQQHSVFELAHGIGVPDPLILDIGVATLSFGFSVSINFIKMICIILCLWMYKIFSKGL